MYKELSPRVLEVEWIDFMLSPLDKLRRITYIEVTESHGGGRFVIPGIGR